MLKDNNFAKSNKSLSKLPTKKKINDDKKALLTYLSSIYGITYFNKSFVFTINHINNGTLKNLQSPISYAELLDMFKFYKQFLTNKQIYNKKIGKTFSSQQNILNYDLAVILSKHSDYLQELETEKARGTESAKIEPTSKFVNKSVTPKTIDNNEIDIEKMLGEW